MFSLNRFSAHVGLLKRTLQWHPSSSRVYYPSATGRATFAKAARNRVTFFRRSPMDSAISPASVLYHYPCPDGAFAALAAYLYHSAMGMPVRFVPNTVFNPRKVEELGVTTKDTVYLLDFVGPTGFAESLAKKAGQVIVLDHHKTAAEMLPSPSNAPPNLHIELDMARSGATIAWDYFAQQFKASAPKRGSPRGSNKGDGLFGLTTSEQQRVHRLFKYVEDADLWKWELPDSKEFSSGLKDMAPDFDASAKLDVFEKLVQLDPAVVIERGRASLAAKERLIAAALKKSFQMALGGGQFGTCLAVVVEGDLLRLRSDLGNQLAAKSRDEGLRAVGAVAYVEPAMGVTSKIKVSLRSMGPDEDTTPASQAYGGGGHSNASSFLVERAVFEQWALKRQI